MEGNIKSEAEKMGVAILPLEAMAEAVFHAHVDDTYTPREIINAIALSIAEQINLIKSKQPKENL